MTTSLHSTARALAHREKYARGSISTTGAEGYVNVSWNATEDHRCLHPPGGGLIGQLHDQIVCIDEISCPMAFRKFRVSRLELLQSAHPIASVREHTRQSQRRP